MKTKMYSMMCLAVLVYACSMVSADENQVTAIGNGGNWEDTSTWTLGHVPLASEDVSVIWGRSCVLNSADGVFATNLAIGYGVGVSPVSTLTMNGGTLTGTNFNISYDSYGRFIMNDGFTDIFQTNVGLWGAATTNGYMEMNGGLFTTDWMSVCLNVGGTGHIQMNGGRIDVGRSLGYGTRYTQ